jgi:hypothetical protein
MPRAVGQCVSTEATRCKAIQACAARLPLNLSVLCLKADLCRPSVDWEPAGHPDRRRVCRTSGAGAGREASPAIAPRARSATVCSSRSRDLSPLPWRTAASRRRGRGRGPRAPAPPRRAGRSATAPRPPHQRRIADSRRRPARAGPRSARRLDVGQHLRRPAASSWMAALSMKVTAMHRSRHA